MLLMTLLVRDEADIIKYNLDHHFNFGVDKIMVMDNGSVDGTRDIITQYGKDIIIIDNPVQDYRQSEWVTGMNVKAKELGAKYIINADADEFFFNRSKNLKDEFLNHPENAFTIELVNVGLLYNDGNESFPNDTKCMILDNYTSEGVRMKWPRKAMYKVQDYPVVIAQGNHNVDGIPDHVEAKETIIFHFPYRSKKHFFTKIINGGKAYEDGPKSNCGFGHHWRAMYNLYKENKLEDYYKEHIVLHPNDNFVEFTKREDLGLI